MSWTVGSMLAGRFRLDAALGANGNPRVWAATHLATGRRVAIRRLEVPTAMPPRGLGALVSELRSIAAVDHPNVAELYEVVEDLDDAPLMISELLRGETLERKLTQHPMLSLRQTASLLLPVVSAVGTAHARGIVHGGLSAASVFLWGGAGAVPAVKVLNFGLAKWMAAVEPARAGILATRRASAYEPPETELPGRVIDHRADIWALGVILYECLSGLRPRDFVPRDADLTASATFMPIDQRAPAVPRAVSDIISHLLVSDPDHRAQNLTELFNALSPLGERPSPNFGWPGSERRISGLTQKLIAPERSMAAAAAAASSAASRVNWRTLALAATGLATVELAAIAWLLTRSPGPTTEESIVALNVAPSRTLLITEPPGDPRASDTPPIDAPSGDPAPSPATTPVAAPSRRVAFQAAGAAPAPARPPLIDDFEDGNAAPLADGFGNWQSFSINPAGRALPLRLGPGHESRGSVELQWMLDDVIEGRERRSGAGLRSSARSGVIDLSRYASITFAHRYAPMNTPGLECKGATAFVVFFTCRALGDGSVPQFEKTVSVSDGWTVASVELAAFTEATAAGEPATSLEACLAATDSFGFRADASTDVDSGGCDSGMLWLDDIAFL